MTFQELARARYSVRSFKDAPIEQEKMDLILEAGRVAPTACNNQPQKIFVAKSEESRGKLASVCRCTFDAPVILVVCYDRSRDWKNKLQPGYESGETSPFPPCSPWATPPTTPLPCRCIPSIGTLRIRSKKSDT